jgi:serine/threonine protein kinase
MSDEEWQRLQEFVRRFDQACRHGDGVDLEKYLPAPEDSLRGQALEALIAVDLEACWRAGRGVRIEDYLPRFPELGTARTMPAALIVAEYRARSLHGDSPSLDVYQRRFPDQFPEVVERLATGGPRAASVPAKPPVERPHTPPPSGPSFVPLSGGYKLIRRIGCGGFAEVWEAEAPGGFPVAVKIIFRPLEHDEAQRELKALEVVRRLSHHYLLQTHAAWVQDGRLYVAMELAEGSLRDRLKECRRAGLPGVAVNDLLRYLHEAAEALDYLHAEKVQHRDIKPDNILLLRGHAKVGDFGLARLQDKQLPQTVTGSGTPAYMPPEVWSGKLHPNSDQYSLAVTYAELRLDRRPFAGSSPQELMMSHIGAKPDLGPLSPAEQGVILRALSPAPSERYGSCLEFVRALAAVAPEDIEALPTRRSAAAPPPSKLLERRPGGQLSGPPTDENSSLAAVSQARRGPASDSRWRRTPVMTTPRTGWRGQRPRTALPMVLALLLGIPLVAAVAVTAAHFFGPPPTREVDVLPPNCEKAAGATVITEGGKKYYSRIQWKSPDGARVPFVFIRKDEENQPQGAEIGPFYIMENKVSYDLFAAFVDKGQRGLNNNVWQGQPWKGNHPVLCVVAVDAAHFAAWMGGKLPTQQEWDKAAGLYQAHPGQSWDQDLGPFKGRWHRKEWERTKMRGPAPLIVQGLGAEGVAPGAPSLGPMMQILVGAGLAQSDAFALTKRPDIAILRDGPRPLGEAQDDISWCLCHDMAGNARELTRNLLLAAEQVPLQRRPGKDDRVIVRGARFTDDQPVLFAELERDLEVDSVGYQEPGEETGFRVVIDEFDEPTR